MSKRLEYTPNTKIRQALRKLTLWSRERAAAMKRDKYTCVRCGKKKSTAKGKKVYVEAHHKDGIDWEGLIQLIRERLLPPPEKWECLCDDCHKEETNGKKKETK